MKTSYVDVVQLPVPVYDATVEMLIEDQKDWKRDAAPGFAK